MLKMNERLDIVLFGATGFTGKYCIGEIHRLTKATSLTWGIAGRSEEKLRNILIQYQKKIDEDLYYIPIIIADLNNEESLRKMTGSAKLIINCCGPYRFFGEPIVKACIETKTHQIDVAGEPQYMETMQDKYHKAAQENGVYIVSACGFDSIPADLGVLFLQSKFEGTLNSVEIFMQSIDEGEDIGGPVLNFATWESAVYGVGNTQNLVDIRKRLFSSRLPNFKPKLQPRPAIYKSNIVNAWTVPFIGADRSVIYRTQRHLYQHQQLRPVQARSYHMVESPISVALIDIYMNIFAFLAKYEWGRNLLLKHPKLFSGGLFSHEPPSEEKVKSTRFLLTFYGKGWNENIPITEVQPKTPPNKVMVSCVSGVDPGYGMTCTACTLSAIILLTETDKLPNRGGVYAPGAAFYKTTLIEKLRQNGLNFEIKNKI